MLTKRSAFLFLVLFSCASRTGQSDISVSQEFRELWSNGKAELNWFRLNQARYGEMHEGHAVLIFVKEKLDANTYIKLDDPSQEGVEVLKCNAIRKFSTGIYDYSVMQTTMTPIEGPMSGKMIKSTLSVQDWCGHVYTSFERRDNMWHYVANSYFEGESANTIFAPDFSEDEIYNVIRIQPGAIPLGEIEMIPSSLYLRLRHHAVKPEKAMIRKEVIDDMQTLLIVEYPEIHRKVAITYHTAFPHEILRVEESGVSGWGEREAELTSSLNLAESEWLEYWKIHNVDDSLLRPAGLKGYNE